MTDRAFETRLSHVGRAPKSEFGFVNPSVHRGSTMLYPTCADRLTESVRINDRGHIYGLYGNPTHHMLEDMVAEIEGGTRSQIVSTGLAAVTTPLLAYLASGDHLLMPDSAYWPTRDFCDGLLARMGVTTTYYDPALDGEGITALFQPNTTVLFTESPGSHTFEVQDIPALAAAAHARGIKLLLDNTWGVHFFQPFQHGVDVSIQALTKYIGGHSDILLGAVTTASDEEFERVRQTLVGLGQYASPDDCWLALRGARTLSVRLKRQMESGIAVATWFANRPEVALVRHPALPGAPGHALWKRDFTGATSLFGVEFQPDIPFAAVEAMIDRLALFGIGSSWGGYESLAVPTTNNITRTAESGHLAGPAVRFHIGLEEPADLIADLTQGMEALRRG